MNLKLKFSIMMFLASLTIFSVGFASWSIASNTTTSNTSGTFLVDNVMNHKDCIYMENGTPICFNYGEKGFVDEDNHYVKRGSVSANYMVNLALCKEIFSEFDSLKIKIILEYDKEIVTYNIFETIEGKFSFTPNVEYQDNVITDYEITGINDYQYTISFNLIDVLKNYDTNSSSTCELTVNYNWLIEDSNYFQKYIFSDLYNNGEDKLSFTISATIEGI